MSYRADWMVDICIRSDLLKDFSPDPVAYVPAWHRLQLRLVAAPARHAAIIRSRLTTGRAACQVTSSMMPRQVIPEFEDRADDLETLQGRQYLFSLKYKICYTELEACRPCHLHPIYADARSRGMQTQTEHEARINHIRERLQA